MDVLGSLSQCGRAISFEELKEIQETVELCWRLSRTELAATICEHLSWHTASGGYKIDAYLKLLEKLEVQGILHLPEARVRSTSRGSDRSISLTSRTSAGSEIICPLRDLFPVRLEVVEGKESKGLWNEYMFRYHYLSYKKPFGYHLRYFIRSDGELLGCLLFSGAAKALGVRDRWIGWTEAQRLRNLAWVINNSRFLIFPWVKVKNLASHVLGQITRQIAQHWQDRWGYVPVLLETFVDPTHYGGSCYKASNWQYLGMSTGEGLVRQGSNYKTTPKKLFVKPLVKDWRSVLCSDRLEGRQG